MPPAPRDEPADQVAGQQRDVRPPLPQGRQVDLEGVEPEEQVFAERVGGDHVAQVAVGGADDPDIDAERVVLAHAADLAAFQETQQLDLHGLVQFADLVEEQRAAVGDFEEPLAIRARRR